MTKAKRSTVKVSATPKQASRARERAGGATAPLRSPEVSLEKQLTEQFREARLPMFRDHFARQAERAVAEHRSHAEYLAELTSLECEARGDVRAIAISCDATIGEPPRRLVFTPPQTLDDRRQSGCGHVARVLCVCRAIGAADPGMLLTTCSLLVQQLLTAERDLPLAKLSKQQSAFDGLIIDDPGYVQQSRYEMEVQFTLLADRFECGSVLLTSNRSFSKWEPSRTPMTTAAAIDCLVHHSVIVKLNVPKPSRGDCESRQSVRSRFCSF